MKNYEEDEIYELILMNYYMLSYKSIKFKSVNQYRSRTNYHAFLFSKVCLKFKISFYAISNSNTISGLIKPKKVDRRICMERMEYLYPTAFKEVRIEIEKQKIELREG